MAGVQRRASGLRNELTGRALPPDVDLEGAPGTPIAPAESFGRSPRMFAISAVLIGIIGIFYVRRRSARKKSTAPAR